MSGLKTECFYLLAVYIFCHKWLFGIADEYRRAYFILKVKNEEKGDSLNSDVAISCVLDCLSDANCMTTVTNRSMKKCKKQQEPSDQIELWNKIPEGK